MIGIVPLSEFRAEYEARLRRPEGWLSLAGLHWIGEGSTTVGSAEGNAVRLPAGPDRAGTITRTGRTVRWAPADGARASVLKLDEDRVRLDGVTFLPIARGSRIGLRVWHPDAKTRTEWKGPLWYAERPEYRIVAKWVPRPGELRIVDVLGDLAKTPSSGVAEFSFGGRTYTLRPDESGDRLFFVFRDRTSGRGTYGAGRFLYAEKPVNGEVILDFNRATNPPCAWTPFATCPLPPRENGLPIPIPAGEKSPAGH